VRALFCVLGIRLGDKEKVPGGVGATDSCSGGAVVMALTCVFFGYKKRDQD